MPLGFEVLPGSDDGYLMLRRDGLELHYQHADDVDPFRTAASAFAWVPDVDAFHARVLSSSAVGAGVLAVVEAPATGDGHDDESALRARWAAKGRWPASGRPRTSRGGCASSRSSTRPTTCCGSVTRSG